MSQDRISYAKDENATFAYEQKNAGLLTVAASVCLSVVQRSLVVVSHNFYDFIGNMSHLATYFCKKKKF